MLLAARSCHRWALVFLAALQAWRLHGPLTAQECQFADPSLPAPTDIQCLSFSRTRNVIYFWSAAEDATEYRLEHSVNRDDDFHARDSVRVSAFASGEQPYFSDENLDPEE